MYQHAIIQPLLYSAGEFVTAILTNLWEVFSV